MDDVARTGTSLVITKNGKPVAELKPYRPPRAKSLLNLTKGLGKVSGDLTLPLDVEWDALK
jgi:antitoxin (DNA-binding transcriptional repressor) of toxin-antitoxin stability system